MNQSKSFKITESKINGFSLFMNTVIIKTWKQKRCLVNYLHKNHCKHLKRQSLLKIINDAIKKKTGNNEFIIPETVLEYNEIIKDNEIIKEQKQSNKEQSTKTQLDFFKAKCLALETENTELKQKIIDLENTKSVDIQYKESGRGWLSDEEEDEEDKEDEDEEETQLERKPFSPSFKSGDLLEHLEKLYPIKIPDIVNINDFVEKRRNAIEKRKRLYFPDGDYDNVIKIKLTDDLYQGEIVLIKCAGYLLNNEFEEYGYYREWEDDNIDDEFKNDDGIILDPYSNDELTEYIVEGSEHEFLNGSYTEYQYSEITDSMKEGNRNVEEIFE
jgi:hypothetical protein